MGGQYGFLRRLDEVLSPLGFGLYSQEKFCFPEIGHPELIGKTALQLLDCLDVSYSYQEAVYIKHQVSFISGIFYQVPGFMTLRTLRRVPTFTTYILCKDN